MRSRTDNTFPASTALVSSSRGTLAGGGGGGEPSSTSMIHLPRSTGDVRSAIDVSNSVLEPARRSGNAELEAHVHDGLSLAYVGLGAFDRAYEHAQAAADRYEAVGLRDPLGYVCNVQGMACMGLRRFDEARTLLERGREFGREDCNPRLEGFCLVNLARRARMTADLDEALDWARKLARALVLLPVEIRPFQEDAEH